MLQETLWPLFPPSFDNVRSVLQGSLADVVPRRRKLVRNQNSRGSGPPPALRNTRKHAGRAGRNVLLRPRRAVQPLNPEAMAGKSSRNIFHVADR